MCWIWLQESLYYKKFVHSTSVTIFQLPRGLYDVFKTSLQDVFKTSSIGLWRHLQVVFKRFSRPLQENVLQTCLEDVLKTSWKAKNVISSTRLQHVFKMTSPRRMFAELYRAVEIYSSSCETLFHLLQPHLKWLIKSIVNKL